jgi:hypothetical protein
MMGQKYVAFDASGTITAFYDAEHSPVPDGMTNVIELTDEQYGYAISMQGQWCVQNGVLTSIVKTLAQQLVTAQQDQTGILGDACAAAIMAGFSSSALGSAFSYPLDLTSQSNLQAAVMRMGMPNAPATVNFMCADSTGVWARRAHTPEQITQVALDGMTYVEAVLAKKDVLVAQVVAATSAPVAQAVVWAFP